GDNYCGQFRCGNGRCIPADWRCDGARDCSDDTDEAGCPQPTCEGNQFQCQTDGECIPRSWVCDDEEDCEDGSDEHQQCPGRTCSSQQFTCSNGQCIPRAYRCDRVKDCTDGTDERDCRYPRCEQLSCANGACFNASQRCDGNVDCRDTSDEANCTHGCTSTQFQCANGECIPQAFMCDHDDDCGDRSDENSCSYVPIRSSRICCSQVGFVEPEKVMVHCRWLPLCSYLHDIPTYLLTVLPVIAVIIFLNYFISFLDISHCAALSCQYRCHSSPSGGMCYCPAGYTISSNDSRTCIDFDDCKMWGVCDQLCEDRVGHHQCHCVEGYFLEHHRHCRANTSAGVASIIFSNGRDLLIGDLHGRNFRTLVQSQNRGVAVGVDFHFYLHRIFWTDTVQDKVFSINIDGSDFQEVLNVSVDTPENLAVDWVNNKLYVVETSVNRIDMVNLDGTNRVTLIAENLGNPRGIALDPTVGYLFFSDWDSLSGDPKVERAFMDGTNRQDLIKTKLGWPAGITLDIVSKRLYWVDSRFDYIETVTYDGLQRRTIAHGGSLIPHPYGITLFEHNVYFTDWTKMAVVKANKFSESNPQVIYQSSLRPYGVTVYHAARQPYVRNPCGNNNGGCEQICVLSHKTDNDGLGYRCRCILGFDLHIDGRHCVAVQQFLLFSSQLAVRGIPFNLSTQEDVIIPVTGSPSYFVGIDFWAQDDTIFFSDTSRDMIYKQKTDGSGREILTANRVESVEDLAFDWISKNLYWTDPRYRSISVMRLADKSRRAIVQNLNNPRSIVVHPVIGYIFWTDWFRPAKIMRAWSDGSHGLPIVNTTLGWPNGLAIDWSSLRLYWVDAFFDKIEHSTFDGLDRRTLERIAQMTHPFGLTIFGGYAYFTDWRLGGIVRVRKSDGGEMTIIRRGISNIMHVKAYDAHSQIGSNYCNRGTNPNGDCSHFCFPVPNFQRVCGCPYGMKLASNQLTCVEDPSNEPPTLQCGSYSFSCNNGRCVPRYYQCDGIDDCHDNSDEQNCGSLNNTCSSSAFTCASGQCVPSRWRCDKHNDCLDGSDELRCPTQGPTSCPETLFTCDNNRCIPRIWLCDTDNDCGDGSDEKNCTFTGTCEPRQFQCPDHRCIDPYYVCDGDKDCVDGADEHDCIYNCSGTEFKCLSGDQCISSYYQCDGVFDCNDHSDETDCPTRPPGMCHQNEFQCQSDGSCVPANWECDGHLDCADGSDEHHRCPARTCPPSLFRCDNGNCVYRAWICDGDNDCRDMSDERDCPTQPFRCPSWQWQCPGHSICVNLSKVCDNSADCPNGADESPLCNQESCSDNNAGCTHECIQGPFGAQCTCPVGYQLANDSKTCEDINECDPPGFCSQHCYNERGSFRCYCDEGYILETNGRTCKVAESGNLLLLVASRNQIVVDNITSQSHSIYSLIRDGRNIVAIDFDSTSDRIFWSDTTQDKIWSAYQNGTDRKIVFDSGVTVTESIAVDWVGRNLYWTDFVLETIEVSKMDGSHRTVLISENVTNPRGLVLDPRIDAHVMFWTDWGQNPRIEKASMDGKLRTVIINSKIYWPNGLSIDYPNKLLYFADAYLDYIDFCDYNGNNRRQVVAKTGAIFLASIFRNSIEPSSSTLLINLFFFLGINSCASSPCSHLCLLSSSGPLFFSCACPSGWMLSPDNRNCMRGKVVVVRHEKKNLTDFHSHPSAQQKACFRTVTILFSVQVIISHLCPFLMPLLSFGIKSINSSSFLHDFWFSYTTYNVLKLHGEVMYRKTLITNDGTSLGAGTPIGLTVDPARGSVVHLLDFVMIQFRFLFSHLLFTDSAGSSNGCSNNIGVCQQLCLPIPGGLFSCACATGFQLNPDNRTCSPYSSFVIVSMLSAIKGFSLETSDHSEAMVPLAGRGRNVLHVDVHMPSGFIYWCDFSSTVSSQNAIRKIKPDGSYFRNVVTNGIGRNGIRGIAIDWVAGNLYFTNAFLTETFIEVLRLNTTYRRVLLKTTVDMPRHIVVDPKNRYLFWADYGQNPKIERSFLDCTNRTVLVSEGIVTPRGLAIDHSNGYVYWVDDSLDMIARIQPDGGDVEIVRYGSRYPTPYGITVFGNSMIWVDRNLKKVFQANKEPGNTDQPTVIRDNINWLRDVTIYNSHFQSRSPLDVNNNPCLDSNGGCSHLCFALPDVQTPQCGCAFGTLDSDGKRCTISTDDYLIFALENALRSIHLDPENHSPPFRAVNVLRTAVALDFDSINNRIYFTQSYPSGAGRISYVSIYSGIGTPIVVASDLGTPDGIAFDWINNRVYYSDYLNQTISSMAVDGSNRTVIARVPRPRAVVLDPCRGYMYWTDWSSNAKIERATLGGNFRTPIVSTNLVWPNGLTLDYEEQQLYWADANLYCPSEGRWYLANNNKHCIVDNGTRCDTGFFTCLNGHCISERWKCDNDNDCGDGSDELESVCAFHTCQPTAFTCGNGRCVPYHYRCDHYNDCGDNSDEAGCLFRTCDSHTEFTCNNGRCISLQYVCNGVNNCYDNGTSDERNCLHTSLYKELFGFFFFLPVSMTCTNNEFRCTSGRCIPAHWYCDQGIDCADGSDEPPHVRTCSSDQFRCDDGRCIPATWICDGDNDCGDMSDEDQRHSCANHSCTAAEFTCANNRPPLRRCVPRAWICDGDADCSDALDEHQNCTRRSCTENEFTCNNGLCIRSAYRCDRRNDCGDASDERGCIYEPCQQHQFTCQNGRCIAKAYICDGDNDCGDESDELEHLCSTPEATCSPHHFKCDNGNCIEMAKVCNRLDDCLDNSDEKGCGINECSDPSISGCDHDCTDTQTSFYCSCHPGYKLMSDKRTCDDIDECNETPSVCSQICENTAGSYICKCAPGYIREPDGKSCRQNSNISPYLIFSNRYYLRNLTADGQSYSLILQGLRNVVALDFDRVEKRLYWIDVGRKVIERMFLNGTNKEAVISDDVPNGEGIAVDWRIFTISLIRRVYLNRQVYWTDWADRAYIGRAGMDGKDKTVIISTKLEWPNGLTIDYTNDKLYWADAHLNYIEYSDLDGHHRHTVYDGTLPHPFAITIFEDTIYWTDWNTRTVEKGNKYDGSDRTVLVNTTHRPFDIHVYHPYRQPFVNNPCGTNNGGCSHLCLIKAGGQGYSCECPDNFMIVQFGSTAHCLPMCSSTQFLCADTERCIPIWWKCDGQRDCRDGSDEPPTCPHRYCPVGQFQCNDGNCTSPHFLCNTQSDCHDRSDEDPVLCANHQCETHQWQCANKRCIPEAWQCDREDDCGDNSDEDITHCASRTCPPGQFKCDNGRCIPESWKCDVDDDCGDNSDEPFHECMGPAYRCDNHTQFSCRTSYRCIPQWAVCNGNDDCRDNSDEQGCEEMTCSPSGDFRCDNHRCIPLRWKCDGDNDCGDQSDEHNCSPRECTESEYRCDNLRCIPSRWVCDHDDDCEDNSDERDCELRTCHPGYFQCNSGHCVAERFRCDGNADCLDFSDEITCPTRYPNGTYCPPMMFECKNHVCIQPYWKCDGDNDCGDDSDEELHLCLDIACESPFRFRCENNRCIYSHELCNQEDDCGDGSDEKEEHCIEPTPRPCTTEEFKCSNGNCIPLHYVCDNYDDCGDHFDEMGCNPGTERTCAENICEHNCTNLNEGGFICSCRPGYKASENNRNSCDDINECEIFGTCTQDCKNSKGSYECFCADGFKSVGDQQGKQCAANGNPPLLLLPDNVRIRRYNISSEQYSDYIDNQERIQALDYDWDPEGIGLSIVYFSILAQGSQFGAIKRAYLPTFDSSRNNPTKEVDLNLRYIVNPDGLAVDWVGRHLYWTDAGTNRIEVAKLDGRYRKWLVFSLLDQPAAIAVNPKRGLMYWTDWGRQPKIECAWMDGQQRRTLVSEDLGWPTGLSIDYLNNDRIYWSDSKENIIESMRHDGTDRAIVLHGGKNLLWNSCNTIESPPTMPPACRCMYGGTCYIDESGLPKCKCSYGYTGDYCEIGLSKGVPPGTTVAVLLTVILIIIIGVLAVGGFFNYRRTGSILPALPKLPSLSSLVKSAENGNGVTFRSGADVSMDIGGSVFEGDSAIDRAMQMVRFSSEIYIFQLCPLSVIYKMVRKMSKALIIFIFQESKWSFFKRKMKQNTNFENPIYAEVLLNTLLSLPTSQLS
uniref:EGF-like domain-containing protein n=1 Tax=Pavo cristatus TaxID=9049 RepID=A0A8C9EZD8_PAVCR